VRHLVNQTAHTPHTGVNPIPFVMKTSSRLRSVPLPACACGGLHVFEVFLQPMCQKIEDAAEDILLVEGEFTKPT
jgi:hypothetical protein